MPTRVGIARMPKLRMQNEQWILHLSIDITYVI